MYQRKIIKDMTEYKATQNNNMILMNANESNEIISFNMEEVALNRYPDNLALKLKEKIALYNQLNKEEVIVGNGSSEIIELILKTYLNPKEKVMSFEPTFVMYKQYTEMYNGVYIGIPTQDFMLDVDFFIEQIQSEKPKVVFICNPNNPTGQLIKKYDLERIIKNTNGIVVIDEAYMEFSEGSMVNRLSQYDNLIILKTFSKAWGIAGARVGYGLSNFVRINEMLKAKSPYNLNSMSQWIALEILNQRDQVMDSVKKTIEQREKMERILNKMPIKVYKSYGNFIFITSELPLDILLYKKNILIRGFENQSYRVTVSNEDENKIFMDTLSEILQKEVPYEKNCAS
ncbi:MAG: histidinol-phosphate transaminase [Clostridia bacterium]|nr:histidinol-phosphate transaminase [Clostridia bacterium]